MGLFVLGFLVAVGCVAFAGFKLYAAGYRVQREATPVVVIHQHNAGGPPPAAEEAKSPGGW